MRPLLLTAIAILTAGSLHAQLYEGGIGYGTGYAGTPQGIPSQYQGSSSSKNPSFIGMFHYNISDLWQVGGSIDGAKWVRTGNWNSIGGSITPATYTIADPALSFCARFNRIFPFYSEVNPEMIKSYLYIGASVGMVFTSNDGQQNISSDGHVNYDLENGKGYTIGVQGGYVYYFRKHLGLYAEVAPRYANITTSDARDNHSLESFHLTYYSLTIGVRYRFKYYY